ncbi:MAG: hypothetical protein P4L92_18735 [Rudaea sp.]|nr:hypothetical protein [Rudaea sp.]
MAYVNIPVSSAANTAFSCILDGQSAQIKLETTDYGLYATVNYNGVEIATSRLCLDRTDINSARYLGMPQALFFADLQGQTDPVYTGFGTRYVLCYGDPQDNGGTAVG